MESYSTDCFVLGLLRWTSCLWDLLVWLHEWVILFYFCVTFYYMNTPSVFTHSPAGRRGVFCFCFFVYQFLAILNKGTIGNVLGYLVGPLWVAQKVRVWNLWTRVSTWSLKDKQMHIRILSKSTKFRVLHDDEALSNQDDRKVLRYHMDSKCLLLNARQVCRP